MLSSCRFSEPEDSAVSADMVNLSLLASARPCPSLLTRFFFCQTWVLVLRLKILLMLPVLCPSLCSPWLWGSAMALGIFITLMEICLRTGQLSPASPQPTVPAAFMLCFQTCASIPHHPFKERRSEFPLNILVLLQVTP